LLAPHRTANVAHLKTLT